MGRSRATQIAFQETCLRGVDVRDPEPALLPAAPGHHRRVDVNVLVRLTQMQRDGQCSAYRDCLLGVHAASLRRQVPDKSSAASLFIEKERRPVNGDASIRDTSSQEDGVRLKILANQFYRSVTFPVLRYEASGDIGFQKRLEEACIYWLGEEYSKRMLWRSLLRFGEMNQDCHPGENFCSMLVQKIYANMKVEPYSTVATH